MLFDKMKAKPTIVAALLFNGLFGTMTFILQN